MRGSGVLAWLAFALSFGVAASHPANAEEFVTEPQAPITDVSGSSGATQMASISELERTWFGAGAAFDRKARQTRRRALEVGSTGLEPAARALIASDDGERDLENRRLAVMIAPELPIAHMSLAVAQWRAGEYRESVASVFGSLVAIPRHLEATIWLAGSLLLMLAAVFVFGSIAFMLVVGISGFARASHDLGDLLSKRMPGFARAALLCAVVGLPIALGEGLLGLVLGIFGIGVVYGGPRHRAVLAMAAVLLILGLQPILKLAGTVLDALDADPVATASLAVIRDNATPAQVALLSDAELQGDALAARMLAVRAMRHGDREQAQRRHRSLFEQQAKDPMVLTALGNWAFRDGRINEAIGYYERAQAVEESAVLLFNLSQAYARAFQMEEFELTMQRAQALGHESVDELADFGDTELVADIGVPIGPIRDRMLTAADGQGFVDAAMATLAPGRLGQTPFHLAGGFVVVFLLGSLLTSRFQHAGGCSRCGRRICARCDDSMWSADLCDGCHHLFNRPQGTDPQLRMARLQALRRREERIDKIATTVSVLVPGLSGLLAKRPDLSFVSLLFFVSAVVLFVWRHGAVPDPIAVGSIGTVAFMLAGCLMTLLYIASMLTGIVLRRSQ
jgi:tetratricopeptide (TPR) repeat protein